MKSGDGFVLVFSLTSMESLNELQSIRDQILRLKEVDGYHEVGSRSFTRLDREYRALTLSGGGVDRETCRWSWWATRVCASADFSQAYVAY